MISAAIHFCKMTRKRTLVSNDDGMMMLFSKIVHDRWVTQGSADRNTIVNLGTGKEKEFCQRYNSFRFPSTIHVQVYQIILPNNLPPCGGTVNPFRDHRTGPRPYPCLYHYCPQHSRIFPSWIFPANKLIVVLKIEKMIISRMRSTAVARISNTIRARSATAVGEAKIQTPSDRLNTQERADYALVSPWPT